MQIRSFMKSKKLWFVFMVLWMGVIFLFSHQPGEVSGDLSGGISYRICQVVQILFRLDWEEAELLQAADLIDFPIRKLAHMTEYGILAMFSYGVVSSQKLSYQKAFLIAACYAASDEFHQLFIPNRSGRFIDVCIDSMGACIGLGVLWCIRRICVMRKTKNGKR